MSSELALAWSSWGCGAYLDNPVIMIIALIPVKFSFFSMVMAGIKVFCLLPNHNFHTFLTLWAINGPHWRFRFSMGVHSLKWSCLVNEQRMLLLNSSHRSCESMTTMKFLGAEQQWHLFMDENYWITRFTICVFLALW